MINANVIPPPIIQGDFQSKLFPLSFLSLPINTLTIQPIKKDKNKPINKTDIIPALLLFLEVMITPPYSETDNSCSNEEKCYKGIKQTTNNNREREREREFSNEIKEWNRLMALMQQSPDLITLDRSYQEVKSSYLYSISKKTDRFNQRLSNKETFDENYMILRDSLRKKQELQNLLDILNEASYQGSNPLIDSYEIVKKSAFYISTKKSFNNNENWKRGIVLRGNNDKECLDNVYNKLRTHCREYEELETKLADNSNSLLKQIRQYLIDNQIKQINLISDESLLVEYQNGSKQTTPITSKKLEKIKVHLTNAQDKKITLESIQTEEQASEKSTNPNNINWTPWLIGGFVAITLLVLLTYFLLKKKNNERST